MTTVDEYIAEFPDDVQERLRGVRSAIRAALPDGEERVRYGIPAVMLDGRHAVHYAGWKRHIGLYPVPRLDGPLEDEIAPYRAAKDSLRFLHSRPLPYDLVERLARELAAR
jgi:uncharacterized protein YdhG (YjbR/CyaY superfamily)